MGVCLGKAPGPTSKLHVIGEAVNVISNHLLLVKICTVGLDVMNVLSTTIERYEYKKRGEGLMDARLHTLQQASREDYSSRLNKTISLQTEY